MFANMVLALHFAIVMFVVFGLVLIIFGNLFAWYWVNAPWFRIVHLGTIATVVAEAWLDITCPLTTFEVWLRSKAGAEHHSINFIEYWLRRLLFYDASPWAFIVGYSAFLLLVIAAWWYFPPRSKKHRSEERS